MRDHPRQGSPDGETIAAAVGRHRLGLLADGYNNHAIAEMMFIDVKTVEHHLNSIYAKLRSNTNFENRHPRVAASRLYFQEIGS